jgi:hypothetical protein
LEGIGSYPELRLENTNPESYGTDGPVCLTREAVLEVGQELSGRDEEDSELYLDANLSINRSGYVLKVGYGTDSFDLAPKPTATSFGNSDMPTPPALNSNPADWQILEAHQPIPGKAGFNCDIRSDTIDLKDENQVTAILRRLDTEMLTKCVKTVTGQPQEPATSNVRLHECQKCGSSFKRRSDLRFVTTPPVLTTT